MSKKKGVALFKVTPPATVPLPTPNKQLIQQLRDRLPKEKKMGDFISNSRHKGFNDCLKQVHQLLDEISPPNKSSSSE